MIAPSRRALLAGLAASAVAGVRPAAAAPAASLWQGIDLLGSDGRLFQLRDLRKKVVLLKLWAHWCPACLGELASLTALAGAIDMAAVDIVLVSHPEFWERDQRVAHARGVPFRLATLAAGTPAPVSSAVLLDGDGAYTVPRTLAFRGAGPEVWAHLGAVSWSSPDALARLRNWTV